VLTEKFVDKAKSVGAKIWRGIKKALKGFINFFRKIGNLFDKTTAEGQKVRHKLNGMKLTDDQVSSIQRIIDTAKGNKTSSFPVAPNQPYLSKIKLQYMANDSSSFGDLKNDLAAALSDTVVVANVLSTANNSNVDSETIGAVPVDAIKHVCKTISKGNRHQILGAVKALSGTWLDVKKNGLKIKVNTKQIDKDAQDLQDICQDLEQAGKADAQLVGALAGAAANVAGDKIPNVDIANVDVGAEAAGAINQAYAMLTSAIGQSTRIYTKLNAYRQSVITSLSNYLKEISDNK
jgi:hypothetical protein